MKYKTEILGFNDNINLLLSHGRIIGVCEMSQGIINVLYPISLSNYNLPKAYEHFTVTNLRGEKTLQLIGFQNK